MCCSTRICSFVRESQPNCRRPCIVASTVAIPSITVVVSSFLDHRFGTFLFGTSFCWHITLAAFENDLQAKCNLDVLLVHYSSTTFQTADQRNSVVRNILGPRSKDHRCSLSLCLAKKDITHLLVQDKLMRRGYCHTLHGLHSNTPSRGLRLVMHYELNAYATAAHDIWIPPW